MTRVKTAVHEISQKPLTDWFFDEDFVIKLFTKNQSFTSAERNAILALCHRYTIQNIVFDGLCRRFTRSQKHRIVFFVTPYIYFTANTIFIIVLIARRKYLVYLITYAAHSNLRNLRYTWTRLDTMVVLPCQNIVQTPSNYTVRYTYHFLKEREIY